MRRKTKEEFIADAVSVHGDRYDYGMVEYVNSNTKVKVFCRIHGIFEITPNHHLSKKVGCKLCGIKSMSEKRSLGANEFVKHAKEIHGDRYDYSLIKYVNSKTKVEIICHVHGRFWQLPNNHLSKKSGCAACAGKKQYLTREFIKRARSIHGNKYDYSQVDYVDSSTKISIICPMHNVFEQIPNDHLSKKAGCPACGGTKKHSTKIFIKRARSIHGNKYDYSQVDYINNLTNVKIICPVHGVFEQIPKSHLHSHGCPLCKESSGERLIRRVLKSWNIQFNSQKTFDKCRDKIPLRFDFYAHIHTSTGSTYFLIEYDGIQHFKPMSHWGGLPALAATQRRDRIKNEFAARHNIPLIRISYKQKHKIRRVLRDAIIQYTGIDPLDHPAPAEPGHVKPVEVVPEDYKQGRLWG